MPDPRHDLGRRAEEAAARWLAAAGWKVLARRWRSLSGELDLVCTDPDGALVGVEVRLRSSGRTGSALESVDPRHIGRLRHALADYARACPGAGRELRLDLVTLAPAADGRWRIERRPAIDGW